MAPKRALGLGKSAKERKKHQATPVLSESSSSATPVVEDTEVESQQLTVELDDVVDPEDEISQLKALWKTYAHSSRDNELMINGLIHECDRLLRNEGSIKGDLNDEFHSIYALSLSELAKFNTLISGEDDEEEIESKVGEYFDAAIERVKLGLEKYPKSDALKLTEAQILVSRIPLEYISQMDLNSKKDKFASVLDLIETSIVKIDGISSFTSLESQMLDYIKNFDDMIDIISNFGREHMEGLDSEDEDGEFEELMKLSKKHPLYKAQQNIEKFVNWWRQVLEKLHEQNTNTGITKEISSLLGKSYLQQLEGPEHVFTSLKYGSDDEDDVEEETLEIKLAREEALVFFNKAIPLLTELMEDSNPDTLVDLAELEISMGNLYDVGSVEQEEYYKKAETKLRKLNNITHGKYQDILDTIVSEDN